LASVAWEIVETTNYDLAWQTWGTPSPATEFAMLLANEIITLRLREGNDVAYETLATYSANACFDGDIANDVNRTEPTDPRFVSACLDGRIPLPSDEVCAVSSSASSAATFPPTSSAATFPPAPTTSLPPTPETTVASESLLRNGAPAPWERAAAPSDLGLDALVESLRTDPQLASCPIIWPADDRVRWDGLGEGGPGFVALTLGIDIETPGGSDYGGASLFISGMEPEGFGEAGSGDSIENYTLANGDQAAVSLAESNSIRISIAGSDCVWLFGAGSGFGLEVITESLVTIADG
jgi:hypothetical protein